MGPGRGALTWKGAMGMCYPQDPLFTSLSPFTRPPVEAESIHKTLIWKINVKFSLQNQQYSENIAILAPEAPIWPRFSSNGLIWLIIGSQAPVFDESPLTSSHFQGNLSAPKPPSLEIGAAYTYQKKVACPSPRVMGSMEDRKCNLENNK